MVLRAEWATQFAVANVPLFCNTSSAAMWQRYKKTLKVDVCNKWTKSNKWGISEPKFSLKVATKTRSVYRQSTWHMKAISLGWIKKKTRPVSKVSFPSLELVCKFSSVLYDCQLGDRKNICPVKTYTTQLRRFSSGTSGERKHWKNWQNKVHTENALLIQQVTYLAS